jgi:hypothetical protein
MTYILLSVGVVAFFIKMSIQIVIENPEKSFLEKIFWYSPKYSFKYLLPLKKEKSNYITWWITTICLCLFYFCFFVLCTKIYLKHH